MSDILSLGRDRGPRWRWQRAAAIVGVVVALAAVFIWHVPSLRQHAGRTRHAQPGHQVLRAATTESGLPKLSAPAFPGGGRLLLDNGADLSWLYSDGRSVQIPGRFDGAEVSSGHLLAWRYTNSGAAYYMMNLNGSRQRLVLPAGHDTKLSVIGALLSPDGAALAYVRQDMVSPAIVTDTLWVLSPATGHRSDLGPISNLVAWTDSTTILAAAPYGKSLQLISAVTGLRTTYLTVTNRVLVHAYERARPGAGPPAYIGSDGINGRGHAAHIAVWLAARRNMGVFRPAEVVLAGGVPRVTYAPALRSNSALAGDRTAWS